MKCKKCIQYHKMFLYLYDALLSSTEPWLVEARNVIKAVLETK